MQANWPGLQCVLDDDDAWAWGADDSQMACVTGDSYTCLHYNVTSEVRGACGGACNATDEWRLALAEKTGRNVSSLGGMVGSSYLAVCEWEMIRSLPRTCNGTFARTAPSAASNNLAPNYANVTYGETKTYFGGSDAAALWDSCNAHAFCWTCAEEDGSLNKYCEAVMQKYAWGSAYTPSDAKGRAFDDLLDYWCTGAVLASIHDGTYKAKVVAGEL